MRQTVAGLMLANAALFLSGAAKHAGVRIGPLSEPTILPASIVETLCALALTGGGFAAWTRSRRAWPAAVSACPPLGIAIHILPEIGGFEHACLARLLSTGGVTALG